MPCLDLVRVQIVKSLYYPFKLMQPLTPLSIYRFLRVDRTCKVVLLITLKIAGQK